MNDHTTPKTSRSGSRVLAAAAILALTAPLGIAWAATKSKPIMTPQMMAGYIPVNGKRVVLILPIQTSDTWTANPTFTANLKQRASTELRDALLNTGQFSLIEVNRFNPVLQRGIIDEQYTQEDLDGLIEDPTPDNARNLLSKINFDRVPKMPFTQAPLIAQITLDTYPTKPGSQTVQVTGTLYEMGESENTVFRTKTVVASLTAMRPMMTPQSKNRKKSRKKQIEEPVVYRTSDLLLNALNNAFAQIANDFARPLRAAEAPFLAIPAGPTLGATPTAAAPPPVNATAAPKPIPTEITRENAAKNNDKDDDAPGAADNANAKEEVDAGNNGDNGGDTMENGGDAMDNGDGN